MRFIHKFTYEERLLNASKQLSDRLDTLIIVLYASLLVTLVVIFITAFASFIYLALVLLWMAMLVDVYRQTKFGLLPDEVM